MAVLLQFAAKAKNGAIIHQGEMGICLVGCDSKNETFAVKLHECCSCRLYAMLVGRAHRKQSRELQISNMLY